MKKRGYIFAAATMGYGQPCLPPPRHKFCPQDLPSWEMVQATPHDDGVTVVWRSSVETEESDIWPGTGGG